jgi:cephalosporin hydroxylase
VKRLVVDLEHATVEVEDEAGSRSFPLDSPEGFGHVSEAWLRAGWDAKYVYGFTWLGRPIIQLPDDLIRLQEVVYRLQPDLIIETGIAHGGSLVFSASLCRLIGRGRVVGVDIEIRPHNRAAIEEHPLRDLITMIEGSSVDPDVVRRVHGEVKPEDTVLVLLDSNHTRAHVLAELEAYGPLVSPGSYIVAMDGIMEHVVGGPRTQADWTWNNPRQAALEYVARHPEFVIEEPAFPFNEGSVAARVTYWVDAFVKRREIIPEQR